MPCPPALCDAGQVLSTRVGFDHATALMYAASQGHEDTVLVLPEHQALVDAIDDKGETDLMAAGRAGKHTVMAILGQVRRGT